MALITHEARYAYELVMAWSLNIMADC